MRMRQTFPVAFTLASCQAIAAVAIAVTCIILKSNEDASLGSQLPSDPPRLTYVWLNLLYPLALADFALAQFLMVASIDAITASSKKIRMAVLARDAVIPRLLSSA